jgi:hypothetical protein
VKRMRRKSAGKARRAPAVAAVMSICGEEAAVQFMHDCSIELFSEDDCLSVYDDYPASELSEAIVVFTENGIENLRYVVDKRRAAGNAPQSLPQKSPESVAAAALGYN